MKARPYQLATHDAVWKHWGEPDYASRDLRTDFAEMMRETSVDPFAPGDARERRLLADLPTSSGKTIIAAMITKTAVTKGLRVLYVGDTDELCDQPVKKIRAATGIIAAMEKGRMQASPLAEVVVGSMQSLRGNRLAEFPRKHFDIIILDEIHRGTPAKMDICNHFDRARVVGFTGTARRGDIKDLSHWLPLTAFKLDAFDLIEQGYIVPFRVLPLHLELDTSKAKLATSTEGGRDFTAASAADVIAPAHRALIPLLMEHPDIQRCRAILTFQPLVETSQAFARRCVEAGIAAKHCDGKTENRKDVLDGFEEGHFRLLTNAATFSTGVDFLRCDSLLNLRLTRSISLYRQMVGRILRPLPGVLDGIVSAEARREAIARSEKPFSLIIDVLGQAEELGIAGPADLDDNPDPKVREIIKTATEPVDFAQVRRDMREAKEKALLDEIKRRAKKKETLMDARMIGILLHQPELMEYTPVHKWEAQPISAGQIRLLEARGIDSDTIANRGMASRVIEALARAKRGLAPIYAFEALKARGHDRPELMSLDEAIAALNEDFPIGFGSRRGQPVGTQPIGFWWSLIEKVRAIHPEGAEQRSDWLWNFPAELRYAAFKTGFGRDALSLLQKRAEKTAADRESRFVPKVAGTNLFGTRDLAL